MMCGVEGSGLQGFRGLGVYGLGLRMSESLKPRHGLLVLLGHRVLDFRR